MENILALSHKEFLKVDRDHEKAALAAHLVYVTDRQPGILRLKKGKGFSYRLEDKPVKEKKVIERVRKLVIPPGQDPSMPYRHSGPSERLLRLRT